MYSVGPGDSTPRILQNWVFGTQSFRDSRSARPKYQAGYLSFMIDRQSSAIRRSTPTSTSASRLM